VTRALLTLLVAMAMSGCVARQLEEVEDAQATYERCVISLGADDPECEALAEHKRQAQRRYEGDARRGWGCSPAQETCPDRR
jgi:hypothetical protein